MVNTSGTYSVCQEHVASLLRPTISSLIICDIRKDGGTQCRTCLDEATIRKYQKLMASGIDFPPIRVWFDGQAYWLSDGFQRVAAAERLNKIHILAEVRFGSRADAQWDSYGCNTTHGLPRSTADVKMAVARALAHPHSVKLSSAQLARHLGIPEPTLRRWRKELSSSSGEDSVRLANRNGTLYPMHVAAIGRRSGQPRRSKARSLRELETELAAMKEKATPDARALLIVFSNWAFGTVSADDCLNAIMNICQRLRRTATTTAIRGDG
jgi:transposase-like protein